MFGGGFGKVLKRNFSRRRQIRTFHALTKFNGLMDEGRYIEAINYATANFSSRSGKFLDSRRKLAVKGLINDNLSNGENAAAFNNARKYLGDNDPLTIELARSWYETSKSSHEKLIIARKYIPEKKREAALRRYQTLLKVRDFKGARNILDDELIITPSIVDRARTTLDELLEELRETKKEDIKSRIKSYKNILNLATNLLPEYKDTVLAFYTEELFEFYGNLLRYSQKESTSLSLADENYMVVANELDRLSSRELSRRRLHLKDSDGYSSILIVDIQRRKQVLKQKYGIEVDNTTYSGIPGLDSCIVEQFPTIEAKNGKEELSDYVEVPKDVGEGQAS